MRLRRGVRDGDTMAQLQKLEQGVCLRAPSQGTIASSTCRMGRAVDGGSAHEGGGGNLEGVLGRVFSAGLAGSDEALSDPVLSKKRQIGKLGGGIR